MDGEKRKDHRQSLRYPAKIDLGDGTPPVPCELADVSVSGARVVVEDPARVPDQFVLLLAPEHGTIRRCKVIWREDNRLGLQFLKTPVVPKPKFRPRIDIR
jgi:hypothetical protein